MVSALHADVTLVTYHIMCGFSMGHVNGIELLIAELSHKSKCHFKVVCGQCGVFFFFKVQEHIVRRSGFHLTASMCAISRAAASVLADAEATET